MNPGFRISVRLYRSLAAFVVLAAAGQSYAQSAAGSVEGRVQNAVTGDFLNNARVAVKGSPIVVFTDVDGKFRLNAVPAGAATVQVTYTGLDSQEQMVQVTPAGITRHDFGLTSKARYGAAETVVLDPLTVAATREMNAAALAINEQRYAPNIKNVIAADAFGDVSEGNVGEFIKRLPGVTINEAAGDAYSISLRGFAPEFTPITVDGNTVPSASFSATSVSRGSNLEQVSMSNVSRLEVVKSPIPSVSADSLGGSVNLISKSAFEREPRLVLAADDADQDWATQPDERTEIYDMAVYPHAAGYLGFPAVLRNQPQVITPELRAAGAVAADGPLDIQLATSEDGDTWRRSWPRVAVIPRGAPGTFDGGAILSVACTPVHTEKETWLYYTAISATHGAPVPPKTITIGRAEWRRHGFVSADAGPQGGEIETKPLRFGSPSLVCNADASLGELRVALIEVDGRAIPGRGFAECTPLRADETRWIVKWGGRDAVPTDRPLRVSLQMKNVRLFSLECGPAAR
jgi:hypothetical protein